MCICTGRWLGVRECAVSRTDAERLGAAKETHVPIEFFGGDISICLMYIYGLLILVRFGNY